MNLRHLLCIIALLATEAPISATQLAHSSNQSTKGDAAAFTVQDSIEMTRLIDPDAAAKVFFEPSFKVSPDGKRFSYVTLRGNLRSGLNEYSLHVVVIRDVLAYINNSVRQAPEGKVVLRMHASNYQYSDDHAIDAVRWLSDSRTIAFVGRDSNQVRQVFLINTDNGSLRQLTHHPTNVDSFDLSLNGTRLVYAARVPPDWHYRNVHGYVVKSDWMQDLARSDPKDASPQIRYFVQDVREKEAKSVDAVPGTMARIISVSPDGQWGVIFEQSRGLPKEWMSYSVSQGHVEELADGDAFGGASPWLGRFLLVDLTTGSTKHLVSAPAQLGAVVKALWSSDSREVVVVRSFMSLDTDDPHDLDHRKITQFVLNVHVATGTVTAVVEAEQVGSDGKLASITGAERLQDDSILLTRSTDSGFRTVQRLSKDNGKWHAAPGEISSRKVSLSIRQNLNEPPNIVAFDSMSGKEATITDLNPQFREQRLGKAVEYDWSDQRGNSFKGALVLPSDYIRGRRYPVVLQTSPYPFRSDIFLVDGFAWITSASAARAMASRGLLVLQMPVAAPVGGGDVNESWERDGEGPRFVAMMEGAIDKLTSDGIINPKKVGLIGFSRTGLHVMHALTFSTYPIAAATVADALAATPFSQSMFFGVPPPAGMLEMEQPALMGAPFWGTGIQNWIRRSPFFHLDRLHAPLRIEAYGVGIPAYWDTFALLKRQRRPVELIHIPEATHVLITPYSRYTSQQGNVDWFAYWLNDDRGSNNVRSNAYERWDKLRLLERNQKWAAH